MARGVGSRKPARGALSPAGPLHLAIYDQLKRTILGGQLRPGDVLSEADVARRWSVSRTPVREALRQLEREELIAWSPRRGATVARLSVVGLREMTELRQSLDGLAARLAAVRASEEDKTALRAMLQQIDRAHAEGDLQGSIELDDAFHRRIALASGNRLLSSTANTMLDRVRLARSMLCTRLGRMDEMRVEHARILAAIEAGQPEEAERAAAEHVRQARARLMELLEASAPAAEFQY